MWTILLLMLAVLTAGSVYLLMRRFKRSALLLKLKEKNKTAAALLYIALPLIIAATFFISSVTPIVIVLHIAVALLICDLIAFIIKKAAKKEISADIRNISALVLTFIYLSVGWFFAHHVYITEYGFKTDKSLGKERLRIVVIGDAHIGITLDGADFETEMKKVQSSEPDIVVVVGDLVDDDTEKDDMIKTCKALGALETSYGVYFVYGNHDKGYSDQRDFTAAELREELISNGIRVLEDESVAVNGNVYLTGRKDRSDKSRKSAAKLTEELDKSKYIIMLDHQPNDYENEALSGADLVLSGHTHGGHIIPAGAIGQLLGANDRVYGAETRGSTVFVVTSGISGWGIPFKTGAVSEIAVIDIYNDR